MKMVFFFPLSRRLDLVVLWHCLHYLEPWKIHLEKIIANVEGEAEKREEEEEKKNMMKM